ncbi:MAG: hydrolase [Dehalococcoidia bacterium]|nr:MAG: hydrolase [Dehalococcoidia bacterium]
MERLWTPWRSAYVTSEPPPGCILCEKWQSQDDEANLVVYRGTLAYILLNLYPYNSGHLMIAPVAHVAQLPDLEPAARTELIELAALATSVLKTVMRPDGFNLGMNLGRSAGAGIADHLHLHVVPRWEGDTNFMPLLAQTKVLPETLPQTYARLAPTFAAAKR